MLALAEVVDYYTHRAHSTVRVRFVGARTLGQHARRAPGWSPGPKAQLVGVAWVDDWTDYLEVRLARSETLAATLPDMSAAYREEKLAAAFVEMVVTRCGSRAYAAPLPPHAQTRAWLVPWGRGDWLVRTDSARIQVAQQVAQPAAQQWTQETTQEAAPPSGPFAPDGPDGGRAA